MLFKIEGKRNILNHEYYRVTLRTYKDGQASPDVFSDFETNVPINHQHEQGGEAYLISEMAFIRLCDYWVTEVRDFNWGYFTEQFGNRLEQLQIGNYDFYVEGLE